MLHAPYGPRGAEEEHEDIWTDIPEGADMLPARADDALGTLDVLGGPACLRAAGPYGPGTNANTVPDPRRQAEADTGDAGFAPGPADDDPLGSWTGVPADDTDAAPTQDADDL